jgi:peptide/nickel transport system substrate-binding protein
MPDGFSVGMDCPNDRYVNDEAICQAIAALLARVNVKVDLNAQPKAQYFAKVLASNGYDTSFYLLGWTPGSFDSWNVLSQHHGCRDERAKAGRSTSAATASPEVDALTAKVLRKTIRRSVTS